MKSRELAMMGPALRLVATLLLVAGLLLASVLLPPVGTAPVHVLNAPAAGASQASSAQGVNGTIASFAALFPNTVAVYLPVVVR
jgi:hypothetical protein